MYRQTWAELRCPKCNSDNFVCQGDLDDMTGFDPESCRCWKCHACFDFDGQVMHDDGTAIEGTNFEMKN